MKKLITAAMAIAAATTGAWGCTSLIAAKGATADGSVMVTYAADSHNLYGELYNQPAADHEREPCAKWWNGIPENRSVKFPKWLIHTPP